MGKRTPRKAYVNEMSPYAVAREYYVHLNDVRVRTGFKSVDIPRVRLVPGWWLSDYKIPGVNRDKHYRVNPDNTLEVSEGKSFEGKLKGFRKYGQS